jgi:hypothetical protein
MDKHCKGCSKHYSAGQPKSSELAKDYNDWCFVMGKTARHVIGHCKNKNLKVVDNSQKQ